MAGGTIHLGQLLAAEGVRYVVVVGGLAPLGAELAPSVAAPPPPRLDQALLDQNDLQIVQGVFGVDVFKNDGALPVIAERSRSLPSRAVATWPAASDLSGWQPALRPLTDGAAAGAVSAGTIYAGYAPAGSFALTADGHTVSHRPALGWAGQFTVAPAATASLALHRFPYVPLVVLLEVLGWVVLATALVGWSRPRRRRRMKVTEQ
jgi:hypothetical protein